MKDNLPEWDDGDERSTPVPGTPATGIPAADRPPARTAEPSRRIALTRDEEDAWRGMASQQLERFGHPPLSPPSEPTIYRPPPVSGDAPRSE